MMPITLPFNIVSTIVLFFVSVVTEVLLGDGSQSAPPLLLKLINDVTLLVFALFVLFIVTALVASKVFMEIWNRCLSNIFDKRGITLNESYALCVLLVFVF
ncbi:hypothetical protein IC617_03620 [Neiella sp. HB171785]|uniref:Uncharacterized protein n=1 Tax=Neiella litorisoli TaxID=2771431 RepID=A0A8J6QHF7_9GAMM|nr:hypothetical protein [Neiella litorisoli]MBD1388508.1 hypothetical protein [Neiella litorisoli]